ncbi:MAG: DUF5399 family protein [Chlamydiales bacterium]|nr:DUF5399 family protein [Chlamydiales bacterium]
MAKTVDNLGVEISSRFAKDLESVQTQLISESKTISPKTHIDISTPAFKSAFDTMFDLRRRNKEWAIFHRPSTVHWGNARIFGSHLLPLVRSDEFGLLERERIMARRSTSKKKRLEEKAKNAYDWEERYEEEEEQKESDILLFFIQAVQELDKSLIEINGRRSQYQKG